MTSGVDVWGWVEANPCVKAWAMHYVENRKNHAGLLFRFFEELGRRGEFAVLSPEEVLEWQDRAEGRHKRFLIVDLLNRWVDAMPLRYGSKVGYRSTIRQFFLFNHVELPSDVGFVFMKCSIASANSVFTLMLLYLSLSLTRYPYIKTKAELTYLCVILGFYLII